MPEGYKFHLFRKQYVCFVGNFTWQPICMKFVIIDAEHVTLLQLIEICAHLFFMTPVIILILQLVFIANEFSFAYASGILIILAEC